LAIIIALSSVGVKPVTVKLVPLVAVPVLFPTNTEEVAAPEISYAITLKRAVGVPLKSTVTVVKPPVTLAE